MKEILEVPNIVNMEFGSHLYGLNTPDSDIDYRGIYLPELDELLLGNYAKQISSSTGGENSKNKAGDIDIDIIALPEFIKFACKGETFAIDMLHCKNPIRSSDIWEDLVKNRVKFYSKDLKAFVGYTRKQAAKYGIKGSKLAVMEEVINTSKILWATLEHVSTIGDVLSDLPIGEYSQIVKTEHPSVGEQVFYEICGRKFQSTLKLGMFVDQLQKIYDSYGERAKLAKENLGLDFKAISHALRAGYQARDIYKYGDFEYPLKENTFILDVKQGKLDYLTEVAPVLESLVDEIEELSKNSKLSKKVNKGYWDNWLLNVYKTEFNLKEV